VFIGFLLGGLFLRPASNFIANRGHSASGDGFLVLPIVLVSLLVSVAASIGLAIVVVRRKLPPKNQIGG
jgi:hypothetical protein